MSVHILQGVNRLRTCIRMGLRTVKSKHRRLSSVAKNQARKLSQALYQSKRYPHLRSLRFISRKSPFHATPNVNNVRERHLVILGVNGHLGQEMVDAASNRGYRIFGTRRESIEEERIGRIEGINRNGIRVERGGIKVAVISREGVLNSANWKRLFQGVFVEGNVGRRDQIVVVNTIGGAYADRNSSDKSSKRLQGLQELRNVNVKPVQAAAKGFLAAQKRNRLTDYHWVHFSSIAAEYAPFHNYGRTKIESEQVLRKLLKEHLLILRLGYVFSDLPLERRFIIPPKEHDWSPIQIAQLPLQPILGDGEQLLQPVYIRDVTESVFNAQSNLGNRHISAVGPDALTQESFFQLYREAMDKKFRPLYIPQDSVTREFITEFPYGHVAAYAYEYLEMMRGGGRDKLIDPAPFIDLLGRPLIPVSKVMSFAKKERIMPVRSPIGPHLQSILRRLLEKPQSEKIFRRFSYRLAKSAMMYPLQQPQHSRIKEKSGLDTEKPGSSKRKK